MINIILIVACTMLVLYIVCILISPTKAVLLCFVMKPVFDMMYWYKIAGTSFGGLASVLFVFNLLIILAAHVSEMYLIKGRLLIYLWFLMTIFSYIFVGLSNVVMGLELIFRYLNFLLPFLVIPFVIRENELLFFQTVLVASLLPMLIMMMQLAGFHIGSYQNAIAGLHRAVGFFHDEVTIRLYLMYGIVGSIYLSKYGNVRMTKTIALIILGCSMVCMVFLYSKSGYIIMVILSCVFVAQQEGYHKYLGVFSSLLLLMCVFLLKYDSILAVYQKEFAFFHGKEQVGRLFQGRVFGWIDAMNIWRRSSLLAQLFGQGDLASGMHNDFLRVLFTSGLLGLMYYIFFLLYFLWSLISTFLEKSSKIVMLSLGLFMVFILDSVGLVPSLYPAYNWLVWGIISYSISEDSLRFSSK